MGYHTIISFSHDAFLSEDREWLGHLSNYIRSASRSNAENIERSSRGAVKVVATRHHSEPFYVSRTVPGFPSQLSYDEQLDVENEQWNEAQTKIQNWLGGKVNLRTVAQLKELIVQLLNRNATVTAARNLDGEIKIADRNLSDPEWTPTREDYLRLKENMDLTHQMLTFKA